MSTPSSVIRPLVLQGGPIGVSGVVLDADPRVNPNPPTILNNGQEIQVQSARADLDTPLRSQETAQLQVLLRARLALDTNVASLQGLGTYQGVALSDGDVLVLLAQTNSTQNGPWVVHANVGGVVQAWTRPAMPFGSGSFVFVNAGTYAQRLFVCTTVGSISYGTTALTFSAQGIPVGSGAQVGTILMPVAASSANVASLSGAATIDSQPCPVGSLVVLMGQTDPVQNGPWIVQSGAWTRPSIPFDRGTVVMPLNGSEWAGLLLVCSNAAPVVLGTSQVLFGQLGQTQLVGGQNRRAGTATLVAGVATVNNVTLYSSSKIQLTCKDPAGTLGVRLCAKVADRTNGLATGSFEITAVRADLGTETGDTSTVDWAITI